MKDSTRKYNHKERRDKKIERKHLQQSTYVFSPEDSRDYKASAILATPSAPVIPEQYITEGKAPVLNQWTVGSCVAHALATALVYGEYKKGFTSVHNYSRGYIYGNRLDADFQNEGMITREALKQLNHCGDLQYDTFPWNKKYPSVKKMIQNKANLYKDLACSYYIENYFQCTTEQEIKLAIMKKGSVVISINIYPSFGGNAKVPQVDEKSRGGHCMCLVGWDKDGWIIQNSWGKIWGNKGYCHLPYQYPIKEVWGITLNDKIEQPTKKISWWQKFKTFLKRIFNIQ